MLYVVKLIKTIERTVIVDADSLYVTEAKLEDMDVVEKYDKVTTRETYDGWEYVDHYVVRDKKDLITCAESIANIYGCNSVNDLPRALYKGTTSGMSATWDDKQITITTCVEGADCDGPGATLEFPFTEKEWDNTIDNLESQADEMWHEWNDVIEHDDGTMIDEDDGERLREHDDWARYND